MWADTAPFLIASPFLSLNLTVYPSLVPALASVDERTPTPIPPTPLMNALQVSENACGDGSGILSREIFLTRDLGGCFLAIVRVDNRESRAPSVLGALAAVLADLL